MHRAIAIAGALLAALILYLFVSVRGEPEIEVDESRVAAAREQAAAAAQRERSRPVPTESSREVRVSPPPGASKEKSEDRRPESTIPEPLAAAGMSFKSISNQVPDLTDQPFVTKVKEARRLYGRRRYEQALALSLELLEEEPNNRRVLRVVIASSCIMASPENAEKYYERLKLPRDRDQMRRRCEAYGVELPE